MYTLIYRPTETVNNPIPLATETSLFRLVLINALNSEHNYGYTTDKQIRNPRNQECTVLTEFHFTK